MHRPPEAIEPLTPQEGTWPPMRSFLRTLLLVFAFDAAVAVCFGLLVPGSFVTALVYALAIGISCTCLSWALHAGRTSVEPKRSGLAILLGGGVGIVLGRLFETGSLAEVLREPRRLLVQLVPLCLFGSAFFYFYHLRAALSDERVRRAEQEQQAADARLKLLQAQIEPHFLFNTLSNVLELVTTHPAGAQRMLLNLTRYLRGSLDRTRAGSTSLGDPRPEGGEVEVKAALADGALEIQLADTGLGLAAPIAHGVGLGNVRARIHALSQGRGRMVIQPRQPRGLSVRITLPLGEARDA